MLCEVCLCRLRGVWDPTETERLDRLSPRDRYRSRRPLRESTPSSAESSEADVDEITSQPSVRSSSARSDSPASNKKLGSISSRPFDKLEYFRFKLSKSNLFHLLGTNHPFRHRFGHHVDLPSLTLSLSEGCDICSRVYDILRKTRTNIFEIPFTGYVSTFFVSKRFADWDGVEAYRMEVYFNDALLDDDDQPQPRGPAHYECTFDIVPGKLFLTTLAIVIFLYSV